MATKKTPVKKTPVKKTPVKKTPVKKTPVKKTPVKKTPVKKTPVKKTPVKKMVLKPQAEGRAKKIKTTNPVKSFNLEPSSKFTAIPAFQSENDFRLILDRATISKNNFPLNPFVTKYLEQLEEAAYALMVFFYASNINNALDIEAKVLEEEILKQTFND
jgi:hypothetical protein